MNFWRMFRVLLEEALHFASGPAADAIERAFTVPQATIDKMALNLKITSDEGKTEFSAAWHGIATAIRHLFDVVVKYEGQV